MPVKQPREATLRNQLNFKCFINKNRAFYATFFSDNNMATFFFCLSPSP